VGVITEPSGGIVAEHKAKKVHVFKYAGKPEIGEESANAGKVGEYFDLY
jgi:hypothetical protein